MKKFPGLRRREDQGGSSRRPPGEQEPGPRDNATSNKSQSTPSTNPAISSTAKAQDINIPFPDGISVWRDCSDATVDICFVHGLTGNRDSTWTAHEQSVPWPASLLPSHLPRARLLTYGYDAYVVRGSVASRNRLLDHATNLVSDLTNDRPGHASSRPLIFVAHSLGGLVCKEAILYSRDSPEFHLRGVFDCFSGIIFMGTPHRGSWMASWAKIPASALGLVKSMNKSLLDVLETDNELLESNQLRFWSMVRRLREEGRQINVTCFFEELPMGAVGRVVSKESATLEGYNSMSIHANHRDMVKIGSPDANSFKRLRGELVRWEQSILLESSSQDIGAAPPPAMPAAETVESVIFGRDRVGAGSHSVQPTEPPHRQSCHNIPFPRNKNFVGRTAVIDDIWEKLFSDDDTAAQRIAIVGLGGVGKTQVALQVAYRARQKKADWSVFWLPALSGESFEQACREIAHVARLEGADEKDAKSLVQHYLLSTESGHWLLVVDNADDEEIVFGAGMGRPGIWNFLPRNDRGRIFFTTRSQRMASLLAQSEIIELSELGKGEARRLLEKSLANKSLLKNEQGVATLLETLTYLPLAIAQAAAYLNETRESIDEYIRLLGNTEQDMVELLATEFADDTRYRDTHNAVASTWVVSFEQIRKNADAANLLLFLAYVESKDIPRSMLPEVGSEQGMTRVIGVLCGYSFLNRRDDGKSFDMHRLVHVASRAWLKGQDDAAKRRRTALEHLARIFQTDTWDNRETWRQYMPHVLKAIESGRGEGEWEEEECQLGYWMARCLLSEGRGREAVTLVEHAVVVREKTVAESHPDRLASQHELARAYQANGRIKEAVSLLEHVVAVGETTLAESHPGRLASQHALAGVYQANGRIKEAVTLLEHVVAVRETTVAESHPSRLASQHALARAYQANGRIKEAIALFEHVVEAHETIVAGSHPSRLASQHELASAYLADGKIKEAVTLLEHVEAVHEITVAESHPARLASQHELARAHLADGKIKEAVTLLEHVVEVHETTVAESHPDRLVSQQALASAYLADGKIKEAVTLLEHVVAVHETTVAESHPDRLASQHELARAHLADGKIKEAVTLLEHVVAVEETTVAGSHPDRLASQHALASAYQANGQIKEAVTLLEHVVAVEETTLAESHPSRLASQHALASAYEASGRIKEAVTLFEHVVAVRETTLAESHPSRLASQRALASAYKADGRGKEAAALLGQGKELGS
ncbi:hypothetical protein K4F52_010160 [Lecanicillium sp. MT-2017a]|nr:hypothetical protein K4F52_010160 [Lecanicillium sp. MT-2017a]